MSKKKKKLLYLWSCNQSAAWKCRPGMKYLIMQKEIIWTAGQWNRAKFQNFERYRSTLMFQYYFTVSGNLFPTLSVHEHIWLHVFLPISSSFFHFLPEETGRNTFFPVSSILPGRNLFLPEVSEPWNKQSKWIIKQI